MKTIDDGARLHRLASEQVGGTHQHADMHTPLGKRRGERRHHRGRPRIVDATREDAVQFARGHARGDCLEQDRRHCLPQHEAGARSHMAAAFAAFKDETPGAVLDEHSQQGWRGHMQVGTDAGVFEGPRLIGTAPGDDGEGWFHLAHFGQLLGPQLGLDEPQDASAPRPLARALAGLFEQFPYGGSAQQRQRKERESAVFGYRAREPRHVTHSGHRALEDRVGQAVAGRQRRTRPKGGQTRGGLEPSVRRLANGADDSRHVVESGGQRSGQSRVLAQRPHRRLRFSPRDTAFERTPPLGGRGGGAGRAYQRAGRRHARAPEETIGCTQFGPGRDRLLALHLLQRGANRQGYGRFGRQQELAIQQHSRRARRQASRGAVGSHTAIRPDCQPALGQQPLQQNETALFSNPPTRFMTLGDDSRGSPGCRVRGIFRAGRLDPRLASLVPRGTHQGFGCRMVGTHYHDHAGYGSRCTGK